MDAAVLRAMDQWPDVPTVYGWLSLSGRGEWRIRGEPIGHAGLIEFIGRNYSHDASGAWYFQNGPQRVYVTLACTPMVYRLRASDQRKLESHTGVSVPSVRAAWLDDAGGLLLDTALGPGVLDDRDLPAACHWLVDASGRSLAEGADAQGSALWLSACGYRLPLGHLRSAEAELSLGFVRDPAQTQRGQRG